MRKRKSLSLTLNAHPQYLALVLQVLLLVRLRVQTLVPPTQENPRKQERQQAPLRRQELQSDFQWWKGALQGWTLLRAQALPMAKMMVQAQVRALVRLSRPHPHSSAFRGCSFKDSYGLSCADARAVWMGGALSSLLLAAAFWFFVLNIRAHRDSRNST